MSYELVDGRGHAYTVYDGFSSGYMPGGRTRRAQFRYLGRRGGLASGRSRRRTATGRRQPRYRSRQHALAATYKRRQLTRGQFARLYQEARPLRSDRPQAIASHERGLETAYGYYLSLFTRYRVDGNHYRTTNAQRGAALARTGRPRCRRQLQRLARLMAELGLAHVSHVRNEGAKAGARDCLEVELLSSDAWMSPPRKAGAPTPLRGMVGAPPPAEKGSIGQSGEGRASPSRLAPPSAADDGNDNGRAGESEAHRTLRFLEMKAAAGWMSPGLSFRLHEARRRVRERTRHPRP